MITFVIILAIALLIFAIKEIIKDPKKAREQYENRSYRNKEEIDRSIKYNTPKASIPMEESYSDKDFISLQQRYFEKLEEVESRYSVLYNQRIITGPIMQDFLNLCYENVKDYKKLVPYWKRYNLGIPHNVPAYKRICMIHEKQEAYGNAVAVCAEAIQLGVIEDGTKGKMYGRLARLIRKCNFEVDPEIKTLLNPPMMNN